MNKKKVYMKLAILSVLAILLKEVPETEIYNNYIPHFGFGNTTEYDDLIMDSFNITNKKSFVPQGLCVIDDKILVTLYDENNEYNSIISIYDKNTEQIKITKLDCKTHAGGMCYDPRNNNIWVSHLDGYAACYKLEDVLYEDKVEPVNMVNCCPDLTNHKGIDSIAYMCYDNGLLYVGNFNTLGHNTTMKEYKINGDNLEFIQSFKMPNYVQGVTFSQDKIFISRSYCRINSSEIVVYDRLVNGEDNNDYTKQKGCDIETHSLQQQIQLIKDKIYVLTESNSSMYKKSLTKTNDISVLDVNQLLKRIK